MPSGTTRSNVKMIVELDGRIIYTSPEMTPTSRAIDFDINITGGNDFRIRYEGSSSGGGGLILVSNAGFYQ